MGQILLPIPGIFDATSPPGLKYESNRPKVLFDASTPETMYWTFRLPADYTGSPVLKLQYAMASAVTGKVDFEGSVMAISPGDSANVDTDSFDSVNSADDTVAGTAGHVREISITLTNNDDLAAGDYVCIKLSRDADDGTNDTATGDCELLAAALVYS